MLYSDSEQKQHEWKQSFYYLGVGSALPHTSKVLQGTWGQHHFTLKSAKGSIGSDINVINSIEIYGYGRQFDSWVTDVSLIAR